MAKGIPIITVFMGDSITEGQYVEPIRRWTSFVADRLDRKYLSTPHNLVFLNRGVSGETTRQGLERYASAVQNNFPNILTIQFGLNDCNCWVTDRGAPRVSETAFQANLKEMVDRARRFDTGQIILITNHRTLRRKPMVSGEPFEARRQRYNEIVREVARAEQVALCDVEKGFGEFSDEQLAELLLPYPDVLHLSEKGHEVYANLVMPFIERGVEAVVTTHGAT